jgi:hypothetical protein
LEERRALAEFDVLLERHLAAGTFTMTR